MSRLPKPDDIDFSQNLRYLCSYYKSTSEVCRRVGINRQQFNKYLTGDSRPSNRTMRIICDFFGVEEYEILSPAGVLKDIVKIKGLKNLDDSETMHIRRMEQLIASSQEGISQYMGYYYMYHYSFTKPDKILKAFSHVFMKNNVASYKRIERLVDRSEPAAESFVYKYEGLFLLLRDRIFMIDVETLTNNEVSQTVLYPSFKNKIGKLPGLTLGASGKTSRDPICARVIFEYIDPSIDMQTAMRSCGLYDADSPEIDDAIKEAIINEISGDQSSLLAIPH